MTVLETGLLGAVDLPEGVDELQLWDGAVSALRTLVTGAAFGGADAPALLLASVPEPLFSAWAAWRDPGTPRGEASVLVEVDARLHVAPQTETDAWFLGPSTVFVMAADTAGTWCPRGVNVSVAEVVRRYARSLAGDGAALAA